MNRDDVLAVLDALRGGQHEQAKGVLQDFDGKKCCLGVIFHVLAVEAGTGEWEEGTAGYIATYKGNNAYDPGRREEHLPANFCDEFGISNNGSHIKGPKGRVGVTDNTIYTSLAKMNDGIEMFDGSMMPRKDFAEIADVIEDAAIRAGILEREHDTD